jgi:homoserine acetyltransferase
VAALCANRLPVTYVNIESSYGHDAFLLEVDTLSRLIPDFLRGVATR